MERPILGFNVIREMLQYYLQKDVLVNILTKSFGKSSKVQAIFKSMQQENQAEPVYTKKWMKLPANTSITVSFKANLGMIDQRMSMAFTPNTDCLSEGISIPVSAAVVKSGAAYKINVLVVNETSHNMQLDKNIYLGKVEIIKSITPLQVITRLP